MKALQLERDKALLVRDLPKPDAQDGHVLVQVKSASLNHREIWISKGLYPGLKLPCILGADGAGIVAACGKGVNPAWLDKEVIIYPAYDWGDDPDKPDKKFRVLGMPEAGTIAEFISVPEGHLYRKPRYMTWNEAAATPVACLTAWRALTRHGQVGTSHQVLITGIGGGVAQAGFQFAMALGARIFVTSSSNDKINAAIREGASGGVNYTTEDWPIKLQNISGGIDTVLDSSPAADLDAYLKFLNVGAKIVAYGSTGTRKTTLHISKFFLRHLHFIGTAMGSPAEFGEMLAFMTQEEIRPMIHATYPLGDAVLALQTLEKGTQIGKIVIEIS